MSTKLSCEFKIPFEHTVQMSVEDLVEGLLSLGDQHRINETLFRCFGESNFYSLREEAANIGRNDIEDWEAWEAVLDLYDIREIRILDRLGREIIRAEVKKNV
jgi:hypothetical protein